MTCREAERLVTPYIQDKLSGDELEAFLEHLEHCRNCQEELEIYFMVDVGLKQLDTGSGTFDIMGALQKRIAESYARVRRMWRFRKMEYAEFLPPLSLQRYGSGINFQSGSHAQTTVRLPAFLPHEEVPSSLMYRFRKGFGQSLPGE